MDNLKNLFNFEANLRGHGESITKEQMNEIGKQMDRSICKIRCGNKYGTGFFCFINFPDRSNLLPVLITNHHILGDNDISVGKTIYISINNDSIKYNLKIDESTKTYTSNEYNYDTTIIEIKDKNFFKDDMFLDIDKDVYNFEESQIKQYNQLSVYIIQYPLSDKVGLATGKINNIALPELNLLHTCTTKEGSSGSPIIKLSNYQVIGIHKGYYQIDNSNEGILITKPIEEFKLKYLGNYNPNLIPKENISYNLTNNILEKRYIIKKDEEEEKERNKNNYNNFRNEITIIYKNFRNEKYIRIFGDKFIDNNRNICKIIYDNKEYNLFPYLKIKEKRPQYVIILKGIKQLNNIEYMFDGCVCFYDIPDIKNWNTEKIIKMNRLFSGCKLIKSLPDISCFNTRNVIDMGDMFSGCESLKYLPDISKWNTKDVYNMPGMFYNCKSLKELPNISKWEIKKVNNMKAMFYNCSSLKNIPDISKWEIKNCINISNIFWGCKLLSYLPHISIWNTGNVKDMNGIFFNCESLLKLPDISKWNTSNVMNLRGIFQGCKSLTSLPDISKWDTKNVKDMSEIFSGCSRLSELPDISRWNTDNAFNMGGMFFKCESLFEIPNITKWNINKVLSMRNMFYECFSLSFFPNVSNWNINKVKYKEDMFYGCNLDINDNKSKFQKKFHNQFFFNII